jgi:hypothetical protein
MHSWTYRIVPRCRLLSSLQEMTDIVGDQLPGGYCGTCPQCEEVKGEDEMVDCGDERICQSCVDQWNKPVTPLPPRVADGIRKGD